MKTKLSPLTKLSVLLFFFLSLSLHINAQQVCGCVPTPNPAAAQTQHVSLEPPSSTFDPQGLKTRRVVFSDRRHNFDITISLKASTYNYYRGLSKVVRSKDDYTRFGNEYIGQEYYLNLAKQLDAHMAKFGYGDTEKADFITAFVQALEYKPDPATIGDYPKYPIETIFQGGDCEDLAMIEVVLLQMFDYGAKLVWLPGHMAAAVESRGMGLAYYVGEKQYSFIETTASGWNIGLIPTEYRNTKAILLDITQPTRYVRGADRGNGVTVDDSDEVNPPDDSDEATPPPKPAPSPTPAPKPRTPPPPYTTTTSSTSVITTSGGGVNINISNVGNNNGNSSSSISTSSSGTTAIINGQTYQVPPNSTLTIINGKVIITPH